MRYFALFMLAAGLLTAGCNTKGEPVEFAKACDAANDKKTIEVSGILEEKGGIFCSNTSGRMECGLKLLQKAGDEKGFTADVEIGSSANTMDKPERGYKREDVKIRDNAGNPVKLGDQVK